MQKYRKFPIVVAAPLLCSSLWGLFSFLVELSAYCYCCCERNYIDIFHYMYVPGLLCLHAHIMCATPAWNDVVVLMITYIFIALLKMNWKTSFLFVHTVFRNYENCLVLEVSGQNNNPAYEWTNVRLWTEYISIIIQFMFIVNKLWYIYWKDRHDRFRYDFFEKVLWIKLWMRYLPQILKISTEKYQEIVKFFTLNLEILVFFYLHKMGTNPIKSNIIVMWCI